MTLDVHTQNTKTALYHQALWCAALLLASGSWLYQGYINRGLIALVVTALYFALAITNYKCENKLVWLCFFPAAGVICVTAYPITSLWYYLYTGMAGQPLTTSFTGAIGIVGASTAIGIVIPMLICIHLVRSWRHAL